MSLFSATVSGPDIENTACFSLTAQTGPGLLPRVLELFARRGLTPSFCCSRAIGPELSIDLQMRGLDSDIALHLAACFRQIPSVRTVLTYNLTDRHGLRIAAFDTSVVKADIRLWSARSCVVYNFGRTE